MRAIALVLCIGLIVVAQAQSKADTQQGQEQEKKETGKETDRDDLDALRRAAAAAAAEGAKAAEEGAEETVFKSGNLGLQALNPEISVTGDMLGAYQSGNDEAAVWDSAFRNLGLHVESYLDPYSRFKAAVPVSTEGVELGEAYFTRYGLPGNTNITLGKFRQQFGVVNRWHKHALDWFDFPLPLRAVFGPGGLNQVGLSLEWSGASGPLNHSVWFEVTDADNPLMFDYNARNRPSFLARYGVYQDLSPSTYLEIGATGLAGWNEDWHGEVDTSFTAAQAAAYAKSDPRVTAVYGADLTLVWEPTGRMRYRNVQVRSEAYFVDKDLYAPDGSGVDRLTPWGFYSLVYAKVSRTVEVGARYDYFEPNTRDYVYGGAPAPVPLAVTTDDAYRQLAGAWVTWWQSPFVKFRGGYSIETGRGTGSDEQFVTLQMVFAAGPHKHERY
jgi:hypothetical protein